jgi:predicted metal-dependent peptidase
VYKLLSQIPWLNNAQKNIALLAPFFAFSMYEIPVYENDSQGTAYTNGKAIYMPTWAYERWGQAGCTAVYLHELMHIVLVHVPRGRNKIPIVWNIAVDAVINGFIAGLKTEKCKLPENTVRIPSLEHLSAEEIYEKLRENMKDNGNNEPDEGSVGGQNFSDSGDLVDDGSMDHKEMKNAEGRLAKAKTVFYSSLTSSVIKREIEEAMRERVSWESILSRYLVKYADDYSFSPYDRRFEDFFIPDITGEKITGRIEVDTSGSIGPAELASYVSQIVSLISTFPKVELTVSLFHTESYAEYSVEGIGDLSKLEARSGGTSFIDSLEKAEKQGVDFVVFLTDLYGAFPDKEPSCDVIWLSDGGTEAPFGQVIRLESA